MTRPQLRLTLLGVGAMNSPRYAPAGLLLTCGESRVAFDGAPAPNVGCEVWTTGRGSHLQVVRAGI